MVGILFALLISIGIPVSLFIYAILKKQIWPFVLGIVAFVGSQIVIRLPILQFLGENSVTYSMFSAKNPILFAIIIAFTAGIMEELARFILMRYAMKKRTWQSGFIFGAGHGGIEAVLLVGLGAFVMLFSVTGEQYSGDFLIGGIERLFAMLLHIGLSLLVLQSVVQKRYIYVVVAIFIHGFVNSLVGIYPQFLPPNMALIAIEVTLAFVALGLFVYSLFLKRKGVLQ